MPRFHFNAATGDRIVANLEGEKLPDLEVPTTIIGPKGLLRDSFASLLGGHSYQVTGSHHAAADMPSPSEGEGPRLVLLTVVRTVDVAVAECAAIRQTCPNCKIVGLLEEIHDEDFQKLAHSPIDGCVPLDVSEDVLIRTLDLAMSGAARFVVLADEPDLSAPPSAEGQQKPDPNSGPSSDGQSGPDRMSGTVANQDAPPLVPNDKACSVAKPTVSVATANTGSGHNGHHVDGPGHDRAAKTARSADLTVTAKVLTLSEREKQIVDGVVKGQSNKVIACACGISEATVKVHMKRIFRKVQCSNRTQLTIWALEHAGAFRILS
jgi:two-component system, NarL family, nitrate/nitrite response regulator NarL